MFDMIFFAAPASVLPAVVAAVFGLLVGSFLNVVIHRLPVMMQREWDNDLAEANEQPPKHIDSYNLVLPRSACPQCGHQITALENIPILSWLFLRGKCSACSTPISARYPLVEALTAALSGLLVWHFGSGWVGLASLVFTYYLIAMTFIDADTQFLPDVLTLPLMWMGLLLNLDGLIVPLKQAVIGAAAGYLSLWSVNYLFRMVRGIDGMGGGDFKLLAALGAWLGWMMLPTIILLSAVAGAVIGIARMALANKGREVPMPFGPYLAIAGFLALLFGRELAAMTYGIGG